MAVTAVTPTKLELDVASADIDDASGIVATTPTDGWAVAAGGRGGSELLLKFVAGAPTDTITVVAGDKPPALRAGLGNLTIALATLDVKYVIVESARFMQDDGTILVTCTNAATKCKAFIVGGRSPQTMNV